MNEQAQLTEALNEQNRLLAKQVAIEAEREHREVIRRTTVPNLPSRSSSAFATLWASFWIPICIYQNSMVYWRWALANPGTHMANVIWMWTAIWVVVAIAATWGLWRVYCLIFRRKRGSQVYRR